MAKRYIRISELASTPNRKGMLPVSAPTIWRWAKAGTFPQPVRLGPQTTAWDMSLIESWLTQREAKGVAK